MLPKFVPIPLPALVERPKNVASTKPRGVKVVSPILIDNEDGGFAMLCWPAPWDPRRVEAAVTGTVPPTAGINLTGSLLALLALAGTTEVPSAVALDGVAGLALAAIDRS